MIIAAAQTTQHDSVAYNLEEHYSLVNLASQNNADIILFPEMSITGYHRKRAQELAFSKTDSRLVKLKQLAIDKKVLIIAGAPILIQNNLHIGSFILHPDGEINFYTKQFLHEGEEQYFKPSFDYNPTINYMGESISLAICADIEHAAHAENAYRKQTSHYLASIFYTPNGIPEAYNALARYAKIHSMNILMANFCKKCWNMEAGGKSAFWNSRGELISNLNKDKTGLLLIQNNIPLKTIQT